MTALQPALSWDFLHRDECLACKPYRVHSLNSIETLQVSLTISHDHLSLIANQPDPKRVHTPMAWCTQKF